MSTVFSDTHFLPADSKSASRVGVRFEDDSPVSFPLWTIFLESHEIIGALLLVSADELEPLGRLLIEIATSYRMYQSNLRAAGQRVAMSHVITARNPAAPEDEAIHKLASQFLATGLPLNTLMNLGHLEADQPADCEAAGPASEGLGHE